MRTSEDRIEQLHRRADAMQKQRTKRQLAGFGSASVFFAVMLTAMIVRADDLSHSITDSQFAGSSMLGESAGGFVLAAVTAFFLGVIVAAVIFRYRRRRF